LKTHFTSFDGTEAFYAECVRPDRYRDLFAQLSSGRPVIPRGAGLSYCAASAGMGVMSIDCRRFNRILEFDPVAGHVTVEAGMTLGDLYRFTVNQGWILPVMPGSPSITIGGCIAANIHGKNQFKDGNFRTITEEICLFHPDHGELTCSARDNTGLFNLTLGGFGLTGFIISARLKLQRLPGFAFRLRRLKVGSLCEAAALMRQLAHEVHVLYSWHDLNGSQFGSGYVYTANPVEGDNSIQNLSYRELSAEARGNWRLSLFGRLSTRVALAAYGVGQSWSAQDEIVSVPRAFFPPVGKEFYFKMFGRKGLREYQVLVPNGGWADAVASLKGLIDRHRVPITLASLKIFRGRHSLLNFEGNGVCLTLDAPEGVRTRELFADLDQWTAVAGGIVNISKDSRLQAKFAKRVFPEFDRFRMELAAFDPGRRFDSALRRRMDV
jgi:decaprenylphospho-beta-D-ribofuranose 2-oxidase